MSTPPETEAALTNMASDLRDPARFAEKYAAYRAQVVLAYRLRHLVGLSDAVAGWIEARALGPAARRPVEDPIFVTGNFRSGTSMLERMISRHPSLGYFTFLTSAFPRSPRWGAWLSRAVPGAAGSLVAPHHPNITYDNLWPFEGEAVWRFCRNNPWSAAPDNVLDADFSDPRFERVLTAAIHEHLAQRGARRFINKNPLNTLRVGYLAKLFPSARFVHIVRHPARMLRSQLDMAKSVIAAVGDPHGDYNAAFSNLFMPPGRMFFRTPRHAEITAAYARDPALGVAISIADTEQIFARMAAPLGDRVHTLRYEDLLADFEPRMTAVFAFLGLDDADALVRDAARGFLDRELVSNTSPLPRFSAEVEAALAPMREKYGY